MTTVNKSVIESSLMTLNETISKLKDELGVYGVDLQALDGILRLQCSKKKLCDFVSFNNLELSTEAWSELQGIKYVDLKTETGLVFRLYYMYDNLRCKGIVK